MRKWKGYCVTQYTGQNGNDLLIVGNMTNEGEQDILGKAINPRLN